MSYFKSDDQVAVRYQLVARRADSFSGPRTAPTLPAVSTRDTSSPQYLDSKSTTPHSNRVAPNGTVFATTARGTFMGNRADRIRWLVCELDFQRDLKEPRKYTKLFFLDEAVALSAGHRPCRTCRRDRYEAYLAAVQSAYPTPVDGGPAIDRLLNESRAARGRASIGSLPDGAFVALGDHDFRVIWQGAIHRWTPEGYVQPVAIADLDTDAATVLTPAPSVEALSHGYRVAIHPSIAQGV
jgi:hypothetical protein